MLNIDNIMIIGASGGIGKELAAYFLDKGFIVYGTKYQHFFPDSLLSHENFFPYDLDIRSKENLLKLKNNLPFLKAIINCSGIVEFESYSDEEENMNIWNRVIDTNLKGSYMVFEYIKEKIIKNGSYILMSSTDSFFGGKVNTAYAVSKAGINSLTKSLALMYQDSGIRVNAIAPGWVETNMMSAGGDKLIKYAESINPLRRNGKPEDVAKLVDFLISENASYINGEIVKLDGGYTLQDPTLIFEESEIDKKNK